MAPAKIHSNLSAHPNLEEFLRNPINEAMTRFTARELTNCDPESSQASGRRLPFDVYDLNHLSEDGTVAFFAYALGVASPAFLEYLCEKVEIYSDFAAKLEVIEYDPARRRARLFLDNNGSKAEIELGADIPQIFRYSGT
jgi:hypothetical protein